MNVALTGVSGFIGSSVARRLYEAGHFVTGLARRTSRRDHVAPFVSRFVIGEHHDSSVWPEFLKGADCVVHNSVDWKPLTEKGQAAFDKHLHTNLAASLRLLRASAPRQFIFMSSIAVHHDMLPKWQGVVDEDHPLRPNSIYGAYKAAVEAHLVAEHFGAGRNTCALRPCGVYGIDPRIEKSLGHDLVRTVRAGKKIRWPGGGKWVSVDDVAEAVLGALGNDRVAGWSFNLADCYLRWADWAQIIADILGVTADIDFSSAEQPQNTFSKEAAATVLGVKLDRGVAGIREYLRELIPKVSSGKAPARRR